MSETNQKLVRVSRAAYIDETYREEGSEFFTAKFNKGELPDHVVELDQETRRPLTISVTEEGSEPEEGDSQIPEGYEYLLDHSVKELKKMCKAYGITGYSKLREAELINAIAAAIESGVEPNESVLDDTDTFEGAGLVGGAENDGLNGAASDDIL